MSIQVGIRVRPFNDQEKTEQNKCIFEILGENQIKIKDEKGKERSFTFDHCFWSHDGYKIQNDGYLTPEKENYADQKKVFDAIGHQILGKAFEGYHCCLFAYGQIGSGKTYSMMGNDTNKGIIPLFCDELFKRIIEKKDNNSTYKVQISMLEICNEKVQDLLKIPEERPEGGLKIRESKVLGVYAQGLSKYTITSSEQMYKIIKEGYNNYIIESNVMNTTGLRAHIILTIEFRQITLLGDKQTEKFSMINFVDLNHSGKLKETDDKEDKTHESHNLNKSLLIFRNVIKCLADKAAGKKENKLPPYNDSVLTRILKNALGGNSKTIMLCTLKPGINDYKESLNTLKFASEVKSINNKAIINENDSDFILGSLKEENEGLKKMLNDLEKKLFGNEGILDKDKQELLDLKEQYEENQKIIADMQKTFEGRLKEDKKDQDEFIKSNVDITLPHLVELNQNPQLSHKLKYQLTKLPLYVGRISGNPTPQIILNGIGISKNHAIFEQQGDDIILKSNDMEALDYIFINGKQIPKEGQIIKNKDRIIFGNNTIFIFMKSSNGQDIYDIEWENAQIEYQKELEKRNEKENEKRKINEFDLMKSKIEDEYQKKRNGGKY